MLVNFIWKFLKYATKSRDFLYHVNIRHTFCKSLVKICTTEHKCRSFLWYFFQTYSSVADLFKIIYTQESWNNLFLKVKNTCNMYNIGVYLKVNKLRAGLEKKTSVVIKSHVKITIFEWNCNKSLCTIKIVHLLSGFNWHGGNKNLHICECLHYVKDNIKILHF